MNFTNAGIWTGLLNTKNAQSVKKNSNFIKSFTSQYQCLLTASGTSNLFETLNIAIYTLQLFLQSKYTKNIGNGG